MNLKDWNDVTDLVAKLFDYRAKLATVKGTGLGVTIEGRYQDDEVLLAAVRREVVYWLESRINTCLAQLAALGVYDFPAVPEPVEPAAPPVEPPAPPEWKPHCLLGPDCPTPEGDICHDADCKWAASPRDVHTIDPSVPPGIATVL